MPETVIPAVAGNQRSCLQAQVDERRVDSQGASAASCLRAHKETSMGQARRFPAIPGEVSWIAWVRSGDYLRFRSLGSVFLK